MKKILMLLALSCAMLGSTAAMADRDHGRDHDRDSWGRYHQDDRYRYKKAPPPHAKAWGHESRQFKRGDRLPREYRSNRYYVTDWRSRDLYAPPYGYRWAQVDEKYLLVSTADYVISRIVYGR